MELLKVFFTIAITMAVIIALSMNSIGQTEDKPPFDYVEDSSGASTKELGVQQDDAKKLIMMPSKRLSRFLAETKNPRAADHCRKDNEICYLENGYNSTCCNNKCMDLSTDEHNCGACKKKCRFTETCCRGQCVDTQLDKRHCGECNHRCPKGQFCVFGLCDYA